MGVFSGCCSKFAHITYYLSLLHLYWLLCLVLNVFLFLFMLFLCNIVWGAVCVKISKNN